MIYDILVLGAAAKVYKDSINVERMKSKEFELSKEEKIDFIEDKERRFIHFTSKESAEKILEAGFLIPTKGIVKNHFIKEIDNNGKRKNSEMVYMFDSKTLDIGTYINNLPRKQSPNNGVYEYYAISHKPNEYEINNFKRRIQDGAIMHSGRLDIDGTDTKMTKYVLDLNEKGEYKFNEVPLDFEYTPSKELLEKISQSKKDNFINYIGKMYFSEIKNNKIALKKYKASKDEYKKQIQEKRDFAKANKQFREEQKDKNYIYEQDGKKIVVKNLEYEMIDGKKLQKIAIIGNGFDDKDKKVQEVTKICYMDEFEIENIPHEDAIKYFFNNYTDMVSKGENDTRYIGLPLKILETGELENQYDDNFKNHYDKKVKSKNYSDYNQEKLNNKKIFGKIKGLFNKILGKKENVKMLNEPSYKSEDRRRLNKLGYSSIEAMNNDDPNLVILGEELSNMVYNDNEIASNVNKKKNEGYENKEIENTDIVM